VPRTIEAEVKPATGAFTSFVVFLDNQLVIGTLGSNGKGSITTDKPSVVVLVRAAGTVGSTFSCTVKCPAHTTHTGLTHVVPSDGVYDETFNC
jgi:hypothetical protein